MELVDFDSNSLISIIGKRYSGKTELALNICKSMLKKQWVVVCNCDNDVSRWKEAGFDTKLMGSDTKENIRLFSELAFYRNQGFVFDEISMRRIVSIPVLVELFSRYKELDITILVCSLQIPREIFDMYDYLCILHSAQKIWETTSLTLLSRCLKSSYFCFFDRNIIPESEENSPSFKQDIRKTAKVINKAFTNRHKLAYEYKPIIFHFK